MPHQWPNSRTDAHADYLPPPPYDVMFQDEPYNGEIAFLDKQLGRLFSELRTRGLDERTVTVLTADHGESLGEHGEYTHGIFIYLATTHIPLIVKGPGLPPARVPDVTSQVDLAPTLTQLAGIEPLTGDGRSLASTIAFGASPPTVTYAGSSPSDWRPWRSGVRN